MPSEVRMTIDERLKHLRMRQEAYAFGGNRKRRSQLLDEVEEVAGLSRRTQSPHYVAQMKGTTRCNQIGSQRGA